MLNVSYRILRDLEESEDVLQEAFVTAFKKIGSFRGDSTFGAWLKRIVVNGSLNVLKKRKLEFNSIDELDEPALETEEEVADLTVDQIKQAMVCLPDGFRTVFSLYVFEGYDHREISDILDISESTSKSQYNRAKKKLQLIIKEMYDYER